MTRFPSQQRLKTHRDFDRVFRRGERLDGRLFTLVAAASKGPDDRLGLAVSRRVGGAVVRNRARRLLRESFRAVRRGERSPLDIVILGKPALAECGQDEVQRELEARLRRVSRAGRLAGPGAVAAD